MRVGSDGVEQFMMNGFSYMFFIQKKIGWVRLGMCHSVHSSLQKTFNFNSYSITKVCTKPVRPLLNH